MRHVEKDVMLKTLDQHWREHLAAMDYLRQGIHLRGYAQKDYRFEYKREAFELFAAMLDRVKFDTVSVVSKIEIRTQEEVDREEVMRRERLMRALQTQHAEAQSALFVATPEGSRARCAAAGCRAGRLPAASGAASLRLLRTAALIPMRPSSVRTARWAATSLARAARARSSSIATAHCPSSGRRAV